MAEFLHYFFYVGTPSGVHLFDYLLWSIFQSPITHYIIKFLQVNINHSESETLRGTSEYIHHVLEHQLKKIDRFYAVAIQIQIIQLLIFTEKFSSLLGFEPGTSPEPSRYATNRAILAWLVFCIIASATKKLLW